MATRFVPHLGEFLEISLVEQYSYHSCFRCKMLIPTVGLERILNATGFKTLRRPKEAYETGREHDIR